MSCPRRWPAWGLELGAQRAEAALRAAEAQTPGGLDLVLAHCGEPLESLAADDIESRPSKKYTGDAPKFGLAAPVHSTVEAPPS